MLYYSMTMEKEEKSQVKTTKSAEPTQTRLEQNEKFSTKNVKSDVKKLKKKKDNDYTPKDLKHQA